MPGSGCFHFSPPPWTPARSPGRLFPPGDAQAPGDRLIQLASDPDRLIAMRREAFDRGQAHFTVQRFVERTLASYARLERERAALR